MINKLSFFILGIIAFVSCRNESDIHKKSSYLSEQCNSVDTIISEIGANPNLYEPKVLSRALIRFYYGSQKEKAKSLLYKWKSHEKLGTNSPYYEYLLNDLGYFNLWEGHLDSTAYYINQRENYVVQDTWNVFSFINLKGSYHYVQGSFEEAKKIFLQGYILAKNQNVNRYIEQFSVNLGAIAFQQNQYGTAAKYFSSAYSILKQEKRKNIVLINNLAASLLYDNNYIKAREIISELEIELNSEKNDYNGVLAKINYANILLETESAAAAKKVIYGLNLEEVHESLQGELTISLFKIIERENWKELDAFIERHEKVIRQNLPLIIKKFGSAIKNLIKIDPKYYQTLGIHKIDTSQLSDPKSQYNYHKIQTLHFEQNGNFNNAFNSMKAAAKAIELYTVISDSTKFADINNNLKLIDLEDQLATRNIELIHTKTENNKNRIIITLMIASLIVLSTLAFFIFQNRNQKIKNAELEILNKTQETEFLEREARLNSRITSLSKIIIDKSRFLAETIKQGPYSNEPEIFTVQKELEQLSLIDHAVNAESANEIFESKPKYLGLPVFKDLNETQQRILTLSIEDYKAKEIATALNLSYAYVRNVQTKLRKLLTPYNLKNFKDIKSLKV